MPETRTPLAEPTLVHRFPPLALARLAALHVLQTCLAETINVAPLEGSAYTGNDPRATFKPTQKLLNAASQGIAALVVSEQPKGVTDLRSDVLTKLVKLGVPEDSAAVAIDQLTTSYVMSTIKQTPQQMFDTQTAQLAGANYKSGRV
jgi:hypothetical protein